MKPGQLKWQIGLFQFCQRGAVLEGLFARSITRPIWMSITCPPVVVGIECFEALTNTLPRLLVRKASPLGLIYACAWRNYTSRFVLLDHLATRYGKRICQRVIDCDEAGMVVFWVERLVGFRESDGVFQVRWKGYPALFDTWEPPSNLGQHADLLIHRYEEQRPPKKWKME